VKQPRPLPTEAPFISFYTPTYRRPSRLAKCMASVGRQTLAHEVEQLVVPDHAGYGVVGGLYGRLPWYAETLRGQYVHILCDDDELVSETVVANVKAFVERKQSPEVVIVKAIKGAFELPTCVGRQPEPSETDLSCYILRRDVWIRHYRDYGARYEGDYDHAMVLWKTGYRHEFLDMFFVEGGTSSGRPEMDY
jgi:hypothetical protein